MWTDPMHYDIFKNWISDVYIMLLNVFLSTISTIGSTAVSVLKKFVFNRFSIVIVMTPNPVISARSRQLEPRFGCCARRLSRLGRRRMARKLSADCAGAMGQRAGDRRAREAQAGRECEAAPLARRRVARASTPE
jgi:hypothetical protein